MELRPIYLLDDATMRRGVGLSSFISVAGPFNHRHPAAAPVYSYLVI
jgi:hypothetical protein